MGIYIDTYQQIQAGTTFPVERIILEMNDYEVFKAQVSNVTYHYEPLFRDNNDVFTPDVQDGLIFNLSNGYCNMTYPTGYLFPVENGTKIYERFRESETEILMQFSTRHQPDGNIGTLQRVYNWLSIITFLLVILSLIIIQFFKAVLLRNIRIL